MEHKITLYQFVDCPFCKMVRDKLEALGLKYNAIEVSRDREDPQRVELIEKSGVQTVPVIDIDGEWTGESDAIIEKLGNLKA